MENRLDELFKTKLEHHAAPPSGNAWQRIEGSLAKKNNFFVGWRIAASVLLVAGLLSVLYWSQRNEVETSNQLSQRNIEPTRQPEQKAQISAKEADRSLPSIASIKRADRKKDGTQSAVMKKEAESKVEVLVAVSSTQTQTIVQDATVSLETPNVIEVAQVAKAEKPIVLEFTLAPIQPEVTARVEEKNSGFKKLFTKARDLKNGESGLDISDLTNKLFASNQKHSKDNIN